MYLWSLWHSITLRLCCAGLTREKEHWHVDEEPLHYFQFCVWPTPPPRPAQAAALGRRGGLGAEPPGRSLRRALVRTRDW